MARRSSATVTDELANVAQLALLGGAAYLLLVPGADGRSRLQSLASGLRLGLPDLRLPDLSGLPGVSEAGRALQSLPASGGGTDTSASLAPAPAPVALPPNATGGTLAGNSFAVTTDSGAWRLLGGNWTARVAVNHRGGGGTFVAIVQVRDAGLFSLGPGAGDWQQVFSVPFEAPASDAWHGVSFEVGPANGPEIRFQAEAELLIVGLSGEQYTRAKITVWQGGF